MKVAIRNTNFIPDENFTKFLEDKGIIIWEDKSSYNPDVIDYIESHANWCPYNHKEPALKGAKSYKYKIGFCGAIYVIEVDTSKPWIIKYDQTDVPYPCYLDINLDEHNRVFIHSII